MTCQKKQSFVSDLKEVLQKIESEEAKYCDIKSSYRMLKKHIVDIFPLNKIPPSIVESLHFLEQRIECAEQQLILTMEKTILEVEKDLNG